jgi:chromate transporter
MDGTRSRSSPGLVLLTFLRLGCTSFGGPIAHLGYFRTEFVLRRKWLDESAYADIVGLCQFLPALPAARSASPSDFSRLARWAASRPGQGSPCPQPC